MNEMNNLARVMVIAMTFAAVTSELALVISGLIMNRYERVAVAIIALIIIIPIMWTMWKDVREGGI